MEYVDSLLCKIQKHIDEMIVGYENYIQLLCTIPGVDRKSAITIISEIGVDMSQWSSHHKLASWAGLAPGCNESAGKKKSVKISRAGVYLKPCLVTQLLKIKIMTIMPINSIRFRSVVARKEQLLPSPEKY